MLDEALWEALRLEPGTLRRRSAFFRDYAESLTRPPDPDLDELIQRAGAGAHDGEAVTWLEEPPQTEGDELEVAAGETPRRELRGFDLAIQGDALREAAVAALTLDVEQGLELLRRSGRAYADAGVPYGMFLLTVADPDADAPWRAAVTLMNAWPQPPEPQVGDSIEGQPTLELDEDRPPPRLDSETEAARDPAQYLYLMLAARQDPAVDREYREFFRSLSDHPYARSPVSVGSTGLPLAEWWDLAEALGGHGEPELAAHEALRTRLRGFAEEHGRLLARAQLTDQWTEGHAPVDVVDLDIAATTCLATKRMLADNAVPWNVDDLARVTPLARASLLVGIQMAGWDEERGAGDRTRF